MSNNGLERYCTYDSRSVPLLQPSNVLPPIILATGRSASYDCVRPPQRDGARLVGGLRLSPAIGVIDAIQWLEG